MGNPFVDLGARLQKRVDRMLAPLTPNELRAVGHVAIAIIIIRTKRGIDADGRPFAPYTAAYAEKRRARRLGTKPDLAVTGHMLGAMIAEPGHEEVDIRFLGANDEAKARGNNKLRNFFAIRAKGEVEQIEDAVVDIVKARYP